jgi:hypothetical protein
MVVRLILLTAQYERRLIGERTKAGLRGHWVDAAVYALFAVVVATVA